MLAVGVNEDGQREVIEHGSCRGATSDAHEGLKQALQKAFPGPIWPTVSIALPADLKRLDLVRIGTSLR